MKRSVPIGPRSWRLAAALACLLLPSLAEAKFAAIAYNSTTGAYGFANDFDTRDGAEERALQECGRGCEVVAWVENACAVLAVGDKKGWGWSYDKTKEGATSRALQECSRRTTGCAVKCWTCSG